MVGEIVYELGPDGRTLREIPYLEYAHEAIGDDCPTPDTLRERWLNPELRRELQGRLEDDGVDLEELAAVFKLDECDPSTCWPTPCSVRPCPPGRIGWTG